MLHLTVIFVCSQSRKPTSSCPPVVMPPVFVPCPMQRRRLGFPLVRCRGLFFSCRCARIAPLSLALCLDGHAYRQICCVSAQVVLLLHFCAVVATPDEAQAHEDAAFRCALAGGHLVKGSWLECPRPILPAALSGSSALDSNLPCTAVPYGGPAEPAEYTLASFYGLPASGSDPTLRVSRSL